jgi:uncharacterized OsmC-like protein
MHISASIINSGERNEITVSTNNSSKELSIPSKPEGKGSAVNGGELLFSALATCVCNDVYREAAKRQIEIKSVEVKVTGEFGKEGEAGFNIEYSVNTNANASEEEIRELISYVDKVAEIHNTLRVGTTVTLKNK